MASHESCPFTVCDKDGKILRTGYAPRSMVDAQARDGEFVFPIETDQGSQWVDTSSGGIHDIVAHDTEGKPLPKGSVPDGMVFCYQTKGWVQDIPTTEVTGPIKFEDFFRAYAVGGVHLEHFMRRAAQQLGIGERT